MGLEGYSFCIVCSSVDWLVWVCNEKNLLIITKWYVILFFYFNILKLDIVYFKKIEKLFGKWWELEKGLVI